MKAYKCKKCGETMISKDVFRRNHFCSDQVAAIMTNITNVITSVKDDGRRKVVIEFPWSDTDSDWEDDQLEMECLKIVRELTDDQVRHWLCDHDWSEDKDRALG